MTVKPRIAINAKGKETVMFLKIAYNEILTTSPAFKEKDKRLLLPMDERKPSQADREAACMRRAQMKNEEFFPYILELVYEEAAKEEATSSDSASAPATNATSSAGTGSESASASNEASDVAMKIEEIEKPNEDKKPAVTVKREEPDEDKKPAVAVKIEEPVEDKKPAAIVKIENSEKKPAATINGSDEEKKPVENKTAKNSDQEGTTGAATKSSDAPATTATKSPATTATGTATKSPATTATATATAAETPTPATKTSTVTPDNNTSTSNVAVGTGTKKRLAPASSVADDNKENRSTKKQKQLSISQFVKPMKVGNVGKSTAGIIKKCKSAAGTKKSKKGTLLENWLQKNERACTTT